MKTRSKSVPKLTPPDLPPKPPKKTPSLHERISSRVFGDKCFKLNSKLQFVPITESMPDNPPLIHMHKQKSFDKLAQSSPSTRVKMLKEARLFHSSKKIEVISCRPSVSTKESLLNRMDKKNDQNGENPFFAMKEKENNTNSRFRNHLGRFKLKINKIKRNISKICFKEMPVFECLSLQDRNTKRKRIVLGVN
jgi:hypothetical protein